MKSYNNIEFTEDMFKVKKRSDEKILDVIEGESLSFFRDAYLRLRKNKVAVISLILIIIIILAAIFVPIFIDSEKMWTDVSSDYRYLPPKIPFLQFIPLFDGVVDGVDVYAERGITESFWFGTSNNGYDNFALIFRGARVSLIIAFSAALIDLVVGVTYGTISGYYGGKTDTIMQRLIEVISSVPTVVLAIIMYVFFTGTSLKGGMVPVLLALVITSWIGMSRITRAQVIRTKAQEYVQASKTLGANDKRIMVKHLFPNIIGQLVVVMMFSIPSAIFFEAFLSFIGLGIQFPAVSLGSIISNSKGAITTRPYMVFYPTLVLSILMLSFNLLANGLRDALDPKMRGK